jgi:putative peptide zinc metalloprotease protein
MEECLVTVDTAHPPRLAPGIELLGELKDSGFEEPRSLIRRADGQVIQLSRLLYLVSCLMDGVRGPEDIASAVSAELGRTLTAEQVRYLITAKLAPLGIVAGQGAPVPPTASPLLALRARVTLLPEKASCAAGTFLRPLFRLPVVVAVIVSVAALDFWIFTTHGLGPAFREVLNDPADLLLVAGLSIVSALFHECGHAAGCRYGGARPGRIGAGIYLVWPAFFTNVTDSYRLGRAGRLRTDLVGVPDLFARVGPVLRSCLSRWPSYSRGPSYSREHSDPRATGLRPRARIVITVWVLCVIPLLIFFLGYLMLHLPEVNRALWQSASHAAHLAGGALAGRRYAEATADALGVGLALMSIIGSLYVTVGLVRRAVAIGRRWSAGRPRRRFLAVLAGLACVVPLSVIWLVQGQFSDW